MPGPSITTPARGGSVPRLTRLPPGARALFDGGDLDAWGTVDGRRAPWCIENQELVVQPGTGDLYTRENFTHFQVHLEFCLPWMPELSGQERANSGLYLQGRYEVQLLDSFGAEPSDDSCGAVYKMKRPIRNACCEPGTWQTFDVAFRAPVRDTNGMIAEHARLTLFFNGVLVHNNVTLAHPTADPLDRYEAQPGPLRLQDHGCPVRFRNIWILPAPL